MDLTSIVFLLVFVHSLDDADPKFLRFFDKLGVHLNERNRLANVAPHIVLDSVSIAATHRKTLEKGGVIFCSISSICTRI